MITILFALNLACAVILFLSASTRKSETAVIWKGALYMAVAFGVFWLYRTFGWPVLLVSFAVMVPEVVKRGRAMLGFFGKNGQR